LGLHDKSGLKSPLRVKSLGELHGSWFEMGAQYGDRAKDYIAIVFEDTYTHLSAIYDEKHLRDDLNRYLLTLESFSPQALEFLKGIARSTETSLKTSTLSALEKTLLIGSRNDLDFRHPKSIHEISTQTIGSPRACSSLAIIEQDSTILAHNNDGQFGAMYHVSYTANPSEEGARKFWTIALAGQLAYTLVNDCGLAITETAGGVTKPDDCDFGVPWQVLTWHTIAHSQSAQEAVRTITVGTNEYQKKTGRSSVLRTGGCNFLIVDKHETYAIESTARRYGIRKPGDAGETAKYLVLTNHNLLQSSFSENNLETKVPLCFGNKTGSELRYWTLAWLIRNNLGRINASLVQDFMSSHFYISETGTRTDFVWNEKYGWVPANLSQEHSTTPCAHDGGYPERQVGGTQESKVITIQKDEAEIRFLQGRPCEGRENWETARLKLE
jgi:hypothetical protein